MVQRWFNYLTAPLHSMSRRGVILLFTIIVTSLVALSPILAPRAFAQISLPSLAGNNCAIATVGWVLCPTMRSIAQVGDRGFAFLNKKFLNLDFDIQAGLGGGDNASPTQKAWSLMQGVANALFVVAFLYIIYNYLVGRTGGAYAIKRLLPRLIIIAILVNSSYWIAVGLIDVSNIVGDSIWDMMGSVVGASGLTLPFPLGGSTGLIGDGVLTTNTAGILGGINPWPLFPMVAATTISVALISTATIVIVIMRQAVVAALIIASPVLIVFYLLPNLERFASQAVRFFFQLLILYPIIALLLGVGQIVSVGAGSWTDSTMGAARLVAAAVAALPLLAMWFLFKNISSVMDLAGARMSASVSSRRGGGSVDKDARVTGKATAGASNLKNPMGITGGLMRKQSFSRNRRRGSIAETTLVASGVKSLKATDRATEKAADENRAAAATAGVAIAASTEEMREGIGENNLPESPALFNDVEPGSSVLLNPAISNETDVTASSSSQFNPNISTNPSFSANPNISTNSNFSANPNISTNPAVSSNTNVVVAEGKQEGIGGKMVTAVMGAKGREKDEKKSVTAKDIFSSMNRGMGHESKDKLRSFSAGPTAAGGTAAPGSTVTSQQSMGPATSFRAPDIASQNGSIVSGSSAGQSPVQVVGIPVAVDPSALLNRNTSAPTLGNPLAVVTGTQKDAEARANKYLFDADRDVHEAQEAVDILGHKQKTFDEQPQLDLEINKRHNKDEDT